MHARRPGWWAAAPWRVDVLALPGAAAAAATILATQHPVEMPQHVDGTCKQAWPALVTPLLLLLVVGCQLLLPCGAGGSAAT